MSLDVNISEPDEFNCNVLHECIRNIAETKGIEDFTYHVDIVSGKGANYIANVFRVLIEEIGSDNRFSVIVKTLVNTARQEIFRELHMREVLAYNDVINYFVSLQKRITVDKRIVLPTPIFLSTEEKSEVIVLEDLSLSGFLIDSNIGKNVIPEYPLISLIITELAKFHALSFVFEKKVEEFEKIKDNFEDIIFNVRFLNNSKVQNYFIDSFQTSLNLINNNDVKKKLELTKDNIIELLRKYTKARKYNVFCHGDCWINNILFKEEGTVKKICFLDFQAMRFASPVTDLLYFIYICTDAEFRSKHFKKLKTDYYNSLKDFLQLFQIDSEEVYPESEYENDLNALLPYGLLVALLELKLVTTAPEDFVATENTEGVGDVVDAPGGENLYQMRVNDVINESIDNGVLNQLYSDLKW